MRIVIKVGTSTLAHSTGLLNIKRVETLCKMLSDLKNEGHEIILNKGIPAAFIASSSSLSPKLPKVISAASKIAKGSACPTSVNEPR